MENNLWEDVKSFYKTTFNIDAELVDIMANRDVLLMFVSGFSTQTISASLNMDEADVNDAIYKYLGTVGWDKDLSISPIRMYRDGEHLPDDMKEACKIYEMLEEALDEKWI